MIRNYHFLILSLGFLALSCGNDPQSEDPLKIAERHNEEKFDNETERTADFMMYAADLGMHEIELAELALGKAHDKAVADLSSSVAREHRKSLADLQGIAKKKNITLPESVSNEKRRECDRLSRKDRHYFDKEYAEKLVEDHKEALKRFEKEAEEGKDKEVRMWAFNMLPALRTHLDQALECERRLGNKGDTAVVVEHERAVLHESTKNGKEDMPPEQKEPGEKKIAGKKKDW